MAKHLDGQPIQIVRGSSRSEMSGNHHHGATVQLPSTAYVVSGWTRTNTGCARTSRSVTCSSSIALRVTRGLLYRYSKRRVVADVQFEQRQMQAATVAQDMPIRVRLALSETLSEQGFRHAQPFA
jgi:hypothetical protein